MTASESLCDDGTTPKSTEGISHQGDTVSETPYSIYTRSQKLRIVSLVAFIGFFSSLSSFIYFPAIAPLSESLSVTIAKINLTVTAYLAVSAITPTIMGGFADSSGRRPVFLLGVAIYVAANVGLAVQRSMNTAPAIGPLLGGLLLLFRGWKAIFWFLSIASGTCLLLIIFFLPETARNIVGNGSAIPFGIYKLPTTNKRSAVIDGPPAKHPEIRFPNPLLSLYVLRKWDTAITILAFSILYMIYMSVQTSLGSLFVIKYSLSDLQGGLVYLPFGVGCALAAFFTGRLLDRDYRLTAQKYDFPLDKSRLVDLDTFPIVRARLRSIYAPILMAICTISGYGWCLESKAHIAIPLVLQFFMGSAIQSSFTILSTLLTDLNNDAPSTAAASNNLIRCAFAGIGLVAVEPMINSIGVGWCFTVFAGTCVALVPFLILLWHKKVATPQNCTS
ncbi:hypothetical protein V494_01603 [Pseudogymnoascus sp. VKM F-4513 (FW-928)]|nr:hypothetical protein V494_01603 [Pseudogymnoascus sp. VKM F-4513 (FW-928)]